MGENRFPVLSTLYRKRKKGFTGSEGETLESSSPHIRSLDRSSFLLGRRKLVSCVCNLPYRFSPFQEQIYTNLPVYGISKGSFSRFLWTSPFPVLFETISMEGYIEIT